MPRRITVYDDSTVVRRVIFCGTTIPDARTVVRPFISCGAAARERYEKKRACRTAKPRTMSAASSEPHNVLLCDNTYRLNGIPCGKPCRLKDDAYVCTECDASQPDPFGEFAYRAHWMYPIAVRVPVPKRKRSASFSSPPTPRVLPRVCMPPINADMERGRLLYFNGRVK